MFESISRKYKIIIAAGILGEVVAFLYDSSAIFFTAIVVMVFGFWLRRFDGTKSEER